MVDVGEQMTAALPRAGAHPARLEHASVHRHGSGRHRYADLELGWKLDSGQMVFDRFTIAAGNPQRAARGRMRLERIAELVGAPLKFKSYQALSDALIGAEAIIYLVKNEWEGLPGIRIARVEARGD